MPNFDISGRQLQVGQEEFLFEKCKNRKVIAEIGSWTGRSSAVLAKCAKNNGGILYCVDWFKGSPGTALEESAIKNDVYGIFQSNLVDLCLWDAVVVLKSDSGKASEIISDGFLDCIFLDGDHRYEYVKNDLDKWFPKLKSGGLFIGHDYESSEYDENFINEDFRENKHHGVIKAVNEKFKKVNDEAGFWWIIK